ncbi:MAG TPA: uracil-DNA glycosylase [Longimicrobiaceae bacterium]|nr:uracil-DNA glycosylase [Longimicrobiaceae bacterium]
MKLPLPKSWRPHLDAELEKPYFARLRAFVEAERRAHVVYPPEDEVFAALELTPYEQVRVMILGQDPYHGPGQAQGLAFSVRPGVTPPPSLRNLFRELKDDRGCPHPPDGSLVRWARQGVLLLNAVLTVRAGEPNSHRGKGWETFTDAAIRAVNEKAERVVFVLWGGYAGKKEALIDAGRHVVLKSAHPSPLSARRGFFGSRPFSRIDAALEDAGLPAIDWCAADGHEDPGDVHGRQTRARGARRDRR